MRTNIYWVWIFLLISACGNQQITQRKKTYFDVSGYFNEQVKELQKLNPEARKNISTTGMMPEKPELDTVDVGTEKVTSIDMQQADWAKEIKPFFDLEINKPAWEGKYTEDKDSSGTLQITTYYAKDSSMEIQQLSVTRNRGVITLITGFINKKSFIVDRTMRLSYMPGKGYGMMVQEDFVWSSPKAWEVFVEIKNKKELYR